MLAWNISTFPGLCVFHLSPEHLIDCFTFWRLSRPLPWGGEEKKKYLVSSENIWSVELRGTSQSLEQVSSPMCFLSLFSFLHFFWDKIYTHWNLQILSVQFYDFLQIYTHMQQTSLSKKRIFATLQKFSLCFLPINPHPHRQTLLQLLIPQISLVCCWTSYEWNYMVCIHLCLACEST